MDLFDLLIEKTFEYSSENSPDASVIMGMGFSELPGFIISQFRYQPKIKDPHELCSKVKKINHNETF